MKLDGQCLRLSIFIGESARLHGKPVYQLIVERARQEGLAGATAWRAMLGFGANSRLHTDKILRLSEDLPVIIEIIDAEEKIQRFAPLLDELIGEGLVTMEPVRVVAYRANPEKYFQTHA
ncbi:protein of unknown function DUF190 [Desulfarculus baarsii DSM 2075]|uniref:Uncharacterized protein n=1 Tax=Desulfarculus baarsii (strain ATCC 33931 / DSM 2075 / LMG 7858 / VKM B-1802 / 2st14) TaxID=644282 RepID=E1QJH7_DESB2|nr:DUF190 domain-containing protein [Desulfarculus baarsii]ADK85720.1 protein of unknown function DUF190 [Desulfarculus baarsii DSM 2075]